MCLAEEDWTALGENPLPVTFQLGQLLGISGPGLSLSASSPDVNLPCLWGHYTPDSIGNPLCLPLGFAAHIK